MASTAISKPPSSDAAKKQLGELLQLEQEPFTLEIFLLERAYLTKKLDSERSNFLKSSSKWKSFYKRRKPVPYCSNIVKGVFNKVLYIRNKNRTNDDSPKKSGIRSAGDFGRRKQEEEEETEKVSSPTSPKDIELQRDREEKDKQLSPVSVLEGISSLENSPVTDTLEQRQSKLSKFEEESAKKVPVAAPKNSNPIPVPSTQNLAAKSVLQTSKQLLFDCVKELVEDGRCRKFGELMGAEELGKLFQRDEEIWSNLSGREANTTRLLRYDFRQQRVPEWWDYRLHRRDVAAEIAEDILDDMSRDIVSDMFELDRPQILSLIS